MSRFSRVSRGERKRQKTRDGEAQGPVSGLTPIDVHVRVDGTATVGGLPVVTGPGESVQDAVLDYLHRLVLATGHMVAATIHDERIGFSTPLQVAADGSSRFAGEPVPLTGGRGALPEADGPPTGLTAPAPEGRAEQPVWVEEPERLVQPGRPEEPERPVQAERPVVREPLGYPGSPSQAEQVPQGAEPGEAAEGAVSLVSPRGDEPAHVQDPAPVHGLGRAGEPLPTQDRTPVQDAASVHGPGPSPAEGTEADHVPASVREREGAEGLVPAEGAASVREPAPALEPETVCAPAPVHEPAPVQGPVPVDEPASVYGHAYAEESAAVREPSPVEEAAPVQGPAADGAAPVQGPADGYGPVPVQDLLPVQESASVYEPAAVQESASVEEPESDRERAPADGAASVDEAASVRESAPAHGPAAPGGPVPMEEPAPSQRTAAVYEAAPVRESTPAPDASADAVAPALLAEPVQRINDAVRMGRIEAAAGMAEQSIASASRDLGEEHPEVLQLRELAAYIAYLAGDASRSFALSMELARVNRRRRDARAHVNVQSAAAAWRGVRDPAQGLAIGHELIALWSELAAEAGSAADIGQLDAARARMERLARRAAAAARGAAESVSAHGG